MLEAADVDQILSALPNLIPPIRRMFIVMHANPVC